MLFFSESVVVSMHIKVFHQKFIQVYYILVADNKDNTRYYVKKKSVDIDKYLFLKRLLNTEII